MILITDSPEQDRDFFERDPSGFMMALEQKRKDIIAQGTEFLGEEFGKGPLYELDQLKYLLDKRQATLFKTSQFGNKNLISYQQWLVNETIRMIDTLQYAQTSEEVEYSKKYFAQFDHFIVYYNQEHPDNPVNKDLLFFYY